MKIALLHGAVINSGDFLIKKRTVDLIKECYVTAEIKEYLRNNISVENLMDINESDIVIIAGGPLLVRDIGILYAQNLCQYIKKPIMLLGVGWNGYNDNSNQINSYIFENNTKKFLERCVSDTKYIGCRDWYSVDVLRGNEIYNSLMTGCPAWYYLPMIGNSKLQFRGMNNVKKICISDSSNINNKILDICLIKYLRAEFNNNTEIYYAMHRDDWRQIDLMKTLEDYKVNVEYISGTAEGFGIYDDCDIHIGFRVHAHIYNLSKRKFSILIEEDGRGAGVNDALGLTRIKAYLTNDFNSEYKINENIIYDVRNCLYNYMDSDYIRLRNAFGLIDKYYMNIKKQILSIKDYV